VKHLINVRMDNLLDEFAHKVGESWDMLPKLIDRLTRQGRAVENVIIDRINLDGVTYVPYRVVRGASKWTGTQQSLFEYTIDQVLTDDPDLGVQILTIGHAIDWANKTKRKVYLIPEAIASELSRFREPRSRIEQMMRPIEEAVRAFKGFILASMGTVYQLGNLATDLAQPLRLPGMEKVTLGNVKIPTIPTGVAAYRFLPAAVKDTIDQMRRNQSRYTAKLSQEVGVTQQTFGVAERRGLRRHPDLKHILEPERGGVMRATRWLIYGYDAVLDANAWINQVRESVLRQMVWLYLLEKGFEAKRAERVVAEMFVDYRNVPPAVQLARNTIMPFVTFASQTIPSWFGSWTGARLGRKSEAPGGGGIRPPNRPGVTGLAGEEGPPPSGIPELDRLRYSGEPLSTGFKHMFKVFGVSMILAWYWNSVLNKELDDRVDNWTRYNMTYLIIPWLQTSDGRPALVAAPMPMDLLSVIGLGNPLERVEKAMRMYDEGEGEEALKQQLYESSPVRFFRTPEGGLRIQAGVPAGTRQFVGGALGGPVTEIPRLIVDQSYKDFAEFRRQQPDFDKIIEKEWTLYTREFFPQTRWFRPFHRQDLDGLPRWMPFVMRDSPIGLLLKVPYSEDELDRLRGKSTTKVTDQRSPRDKMGGR
jgi:hypothetical protein